MFGLEDDLYEEIEELKIAYEELEKMFDACECQLHQIYFLTADFSANDKTANKIANKAKKGLTARWFKKDLNGVPTGVVNSEYPDDLKIKRRTKKEKKNV